MPASRRRSTGRCRGARRPARRAYPVPQRLLIAGLMNYVYEAALCAARDAEGAGRAGGGDAAADQAAHRLSRLHRDDLRARKGDLAIDADGRRRRDRRRRSARVRRLAARAAASRSDRRRPIRRRAAAMRIAVPYPASAPGDGRLFLSRSPTGAIDYAAPQTVTRDGDRLIDRRPRRQGRRARSTACCSVDGPRAGGHGDAGHGRRGAGGAGRRRLAGAALLAFAGAVLGGLILNVMPCVFPILSLKALSLARGRRRRARRAARGAGLYRRRDRGVPGARRRDPGAARGRQRGRLGVPVAGSARRSCCCCC